MLSSITTEYGLGAGTLQYWMTDYYQKAKQGTKEKDEKKVASYFASYLKR